MMKKTVLLALGLSLTASLTSQVQASPQSDLKAFRDHFFQRFPGVPLNEFGNGIYSIDQSSREQWEAIEEFPPYEINIENGESLFNKKFANGKSLADCFANGGQGIKQDYPYYDAAKKTVKTLEQEINECRVNNGEKPLKWKKGKMADISAYMAYTSRGNKINIKIPNADAEKWYDRGKKHFYAKRGQLNLSCANCHVDSSGMYIRADRLSPALGHVSHFPVYRSKWGGLGTLHRRYGGCNKQVRAKPFKAQSDEYRALEYFHSYMSNGIEANGPGARK